MLKATSSIVNVSQITGVLPVANGGTGVTTSTGTGSTVLSAAPTLSGNVTLSTGNLIVASGQGIDFSATPGTGTSELLSDYEEGTWTPTLGGTATYNSQSGTYTKVGRLVTVRCILEVSSIGSGATNAISGLPYAAKASPAIRSGGSMAYWGGLSASVVYLSPAVGQGGSEIFFIGNTAANNNIIDVINIFQTNAYVMLTLTYEV